jgi:hypothetical protein
MKNKFFKYYAIAAVYFFSTLVAFAQPGVVDETDGDTTPSAPINDYLWVLVAIGLVLVYLKFRSMRRKIDNNLK